MTEKYDVIIIGSGINALATLYSILQRRNKKKIAVIAGNARYEVNKNHPKFFKDLQNQKKIFSHKIKSVNLSLPGNIGGLIYFWGEQCNINEKTLAKIKNLQKYKKFFSNFFELKNNKIFFEKKLKNLRFKLTTPDKAINKKKSTRKFKNFFEKHSTLFHNEAISINKKYVYLDNKKKIEGKKIFLCAGLIGTINLIKSIKKNIDFTFKDHSSSIDFVYSNKKISEKVQKRSIYSSVCKVYSDKNKIDIYAKFYPFRLLEILFFIGKIKFFLPKIVLNYKFNFKNFYFIQKWNNESIVEYKLDNVLIKTKNNFDNYNNLNIVYKSLKFVKLFTIKPKFLNFHFHDLNIIENKKKIPVNIFLRKNNSKVFCPGLLSQNVINCLPPSFNSFVKTVSQIKNLRNI
jgi:hypothetical protein